MTQRSSLVHNDLKFDNVMIDPENPDRITAILDWDMTTLGDPLIDLGTFLAYWVEAGDPPERGATLAVTAQEGFPTRAELARPLRRTHWRRPERDPLVRGLRALEDRGRAPADLHPVSASARRRTSASR